MKGNGGPSVWVFQDHDVNQPGFSEKVQAIFRSDLGLQRAYPWILFGPYLALMAWYFPLERERLRRNLPLNAAACLAFAWACHAMDVRTTAMRAGPVMVNSDHLSAPGPAPSGTNGFLPRPGMRTARRFAGSDGPIQLKGPLSADLKRPLRPPRSLK